MAIRKIIKIDEEKCNGCGLCIPNCAEGALAIVNGKAKIVKDIFCDGLGACLGHCPQDALEVIERDAPDFNEEAAIEFVKSQGGELKPQVQINKPEGGCPSSAVKVLNKPLTLPQIGGCPGSKMKQISRSETNDPNVKLTSKLSQWPVQLMLVPVNAPYFKGADLLITADCVPLAYANYHNDFLKDKAVVLGCPKLDDSNYYAEKLSQIIKANDLESVTVLRMEVPCCGGMALAAKTARDKSGIDIPIKVVTISIEGEILKREYL
ncbi:ATP-binding protein [Clostridium vincentii]|uniref:Ferredoxin n=1 Tax=Clostridium vincentii TaxID=52704 RepID=A0A2T0B984_9CLOT|nr:4Fe-4S binding protein [Clostridium vincentii]PRR80459.1 ferredoxin [Clostridium vincentii]